MKSVLVRNEGECKVIYGGVEILPHQYKAISADKVDRLVELFPFISVVPTVEEVSAPEVKAEAPKRGRKPKAETVKPQTEEEK